MRRVAGIKEWVEEYDAVVKEVEDLRLMPEFVKEGVVTEQELDEQYARAMHRIEELELRNMLRRDEDRMGAIMDINSGAGGTEALDWAGMLLRCACTPAGARRTDTRSRCSTIRLARR